MDNLPLLMLGLPKGSLEDATIDLFAKAGFQITKSSRSYRPAFDDEQLDGRFVRAQEVSRYVEHGYFDCGLTGQDWVRENGSEIVEVCDLVYSRASNRRSKWILAVPEQSPIETVKDLEGKRIATEVVNITKQYLQENSVNAEVEFSWGATEVKVPDLVDAIVDLTETGNSLIANKLRIVDTLMFTNTVLIANKSAWENPEKRKKIESIAMLLQSALEAKSKVGLKLNIERVKLDELLEDLPALRNPTVNRLADESWVAIDTILDEKVVREIIPALKAHGAEGIVEYPLNKVVY
ncbi:MAG: ATP phosphoribosyltransferase [Puniceicoccaceae bacterium MED-G31]|jgi:ATP phosphoribosyltransferase|nr:MAG: ATP phosphoribosyltransferase [Puniceicoccaceae bacterium MED-G31]